MGSCPEVGEASEHNLCPFVEAVLQDLHWKKLLSEFLRCNAGMNTHQSEVNQTKQNLQSNDVAYSYIIDSSAEVGGA